MSRFIVDKLCKACESPSLYRLGPKKLGKTFICLNCGGIQAGLNTVVIGNTIRIGDLGGNPGTPVNGEIWLNGTTLRMHSGGVSADIGSGAGTGVSSGVIAMWSGLLSAVPAGWKLCDGTLSTPDLRDKFIYGWTASVDPGGTGGSSTHQHASGGTHQHSFDGPTTHTGSFTHTSAGSHQHNNISGILMSTENGLPASISTIQLPFDTNQDGTWTQAHWLYSASSFSSQTGAHDHTLNAHQHSSDGSHGSAHGTHSVDAHTTHRHDSIGGHQHDSISNLPPYYKLAFIMKT